MRDQTTTSSAPPPAEADSPQRSRILRRVGRLLVQFALLGVVGFYVVRAFVQGLGSVNWQEFHLDPLWLTAGAAAMMLSVAMVCAATAANLRAMSPGLPTMVAMAATAIARMGRYVPGKVLSVAGVPLLLRPWGVGMVAGTSAVLLNSVLNVLTGLLVSAPLLVLDNRLQRFVPLGWLWVGLIIIAALVFLHPAINGPVLNALLRKLRKPPLAATLRLRHYLVPACWLVVQWVTLGAGMWCIGRSVDPQFPLQQLWVCVSTSALAVTVGFLALLAPGGIGVREAIFLAVFTPTLGLTQASLLAVGMRVMTMVTEALVAAVGVIVLKTRRPSQALDNR